MTKTEAAEKIVHKCKSYNSCGDCPLYVRGNFTNCALAMMIGCIPERWGKQNDCQRVEINQEDFL